MHSAHHTLLPGMFPDMYGSVLAYTILSDVSCDNSRRPLTAVYLLFHIWPTLKKDVKGAISEFAKSPSLI